MPRPATPLIQSVDRALVLLETVGKSPRPVSLRELTGVLSIDSSSVFRLANTLKRRGFLSQGPGGYTLGPSLWRLASTLHWTSGLRDLARNHLAALAAQVGETTHLLIRVGREAVAVHDELTQKPVVALRPGRSEPLHCTAVGKALLADFDLEQLQSLFGAEPLPRFTQRTVCALPALAEECRRTRERGFAQDDQEMFEGVRCVAAPIRDSSGGIVAAISITAPVDRLPLRNRKALGQQAMRVAGEISLKLGYTGPQ